MGGLFFKEKKMAKPEWGRKRICPSCGTKYYDFKNSPIICPSCGAEFDPDLYLKSRKGKSLSTKESADETSKISEDISDIEDMDIDNNASFIEDDDLNDDSDNEDTKE